MTKIIDDDWKICDPWEAAKFLRDINSVKSCKCLPACSTTVYSTSHTSADFRYYY